MDASMFSRKSALSAVLAACVLALGALTILANANGGARGPTPPQISPFDLMSKAQGLPDQKIESLF
jgi:hypothetical protein